MAAQRTEKEDTNFKPVSLIPPRQFSTIRSTPTTSISCPLTCPLQLIPDVSQLDNSPSIEKKEVNRCSGCRKKVGLTGIRCRCGELFCFEHRYSDRHACSYDYKLAGKEAIARENPLVKAAKIVKF